MRWEDERYVRVYTRDTGEWLALGWEAQALFLFALRKADRAGIVHTGKARARGLAAMAGMPLAVVDVTLPLLLADGCVRESDGGYIIPNFIRAQEVSISDAQRKRDQRERDRDKALAAGVTSQPMVADILATLSRQEVTRAVTEDGHAMTSRHDVTQDGHAGEVTPNRAVPSRSVPLEDLFGAASASPPPKAPPKAKRKLPAAKPLGDSRHQPLVDTLFAAGWSLGRGRGAKAVKDLLGLADEREATRGAAAPGEVARRAALARARSGFPSVRSLWELVTHWAHFEKAVAFTGRGPAPPGDFSAPMQELPEDLRSTDDTPF